MAIYHLNVFGWFHRCGFSVAFQILFWFSHFLLFLPPACSFLFPPTLHSKSHSFSFFFSVGCLCSPFLPR